MHRNLHVGPLVLMLMCLTWMLKLEAVTYTEQPEKKSSSSQEADLRCLFPGIFAVVPELDAVPCACFC